MIDSDQAMSVLAKLYAIRSVRTNAEKGNAARYGWDDNAIVRKRQPIEATPLIRQVNTRMYGLIC